MLSTISSTSQMFSISYPSVCRIRHSHRKEDFLGLSEEVLTDRIKEAIERV